MAEAVRKVGVRKEREGVVVSRSGRKSIVVAVETRRPHERYGKVVRSLRRYHAHDETEQAAVGDRVRIEETRPLSRWKRWRLVAVLRKAAGRPTTGET